MKLNLVTDMTTTTGSSASLFVDSAISMLCSSVVVSPVDLYCLESHVWNQFGVVLSIKQHFVSLAVRDKKKKYKKKLKRAKRKLVQQRRKQRRVRKKNRSRPSLRKRNLINHQKTFKYVLVGLIENLTRCDRVSDELVHRTLFSLVKPELEFWWELKKSLELRRLYPDLDYRSPIWGLPVSAAYTEALNEELYRHYFELSLDYNWGCPLVEGSTDSERTSSSGISLSDYSGDPQSPGSYVVSENEGQLYGDDHSDIWPGSEPDWDNLELQSREMSYKESCAYKFKERSRASKKKVAKLIEKVGQLSKKEQRQLADALKKADTQSGELASVWKVIGGYFKNHPHIKLIVVEILRTSMGICVATTRQQILCHLISSATALCVDMVEEAQELFSSFFAVDQSGMGFGDLFKKGLDMWKNGVSCKLMEDLKKAIVVLVYMGFNSAKTFADHIPSLKSLLTTEAIGKIASFDVVSFALEVMLSIYQRIECAVETKSLSGFFYPIPSLKLLTQRYDKVTSYFEYAMSGQLESVTDMTFDSYVREITLVHKELQKLELDCSAGDKVYVIRWKSELHKKITKIMYYASRLPVRKAPYTLNIIGGTAVGKSTLQLVWAVAIGKWQGFDFTKDDIVYLNPNDEYFSGYTGQLCVIEDDKNATIAVPGGVNENDVTLRISNNAVMPLNMAAVEDKGVYVMRANTYIMSTNTPDAQAHKTSNTPEAVLRRSHHVVVEVKPEFCKPGTTMLDPTKATGRPLVDDVWWFTVLEVKVSTKNLGSTSAWYWQTVRHNGKLMSRVGMHDMMVYLGDSVKEHMVLQQNIIDGFEDLMRADMFCPHLSGKSICRICNPELPVPPPHTTRVNMGHSHVPDSVTVPLITPVEEGASSVTAVLNVREGDLETQSSLATRVVVNCLWYWLLPQALLVITMVNNCCVSSLFGRLLGYVNHEYASHWIDRAIWSKTKFGYVVIWSLLYSPGFIVSWLFGYSYLAYWLFGDWITNVAMRAIRMMYVDIDRRGAAATIARLATARARPILTHKYFYYGATAAITAALAAYKMFYSSQMQAQGASISLVDEPSPWTKLYVPPEEVDVKRKTTTSSDLVTCVSNRIAHVWLYKEGSTRGIPGNLLPLRSGACLIPKHFLYEENGAPNQFTHMHIKFNESALGSSLRSVPIDRALTRDVKGADLCVIYVAQLAGQTKDLTSFLSDRLDDCTSTYVYRDNDGRIAEPFLKQHVRMKYCKINRPYADYGYGTVCPVNTFVGLCGSVQVAFTKNPYLVSMHIAGFTGSSEGVCVPLQRVPIMAALDDLFNDPFTLQTASMECMDLTDGDPTKIITKEPHPKSPFMHLEKGSVYYHGRLKERSTPSSTAMNTEMSQTVEEVFCEKNVFGNPSNFRSWKPWHETALNLVNPVFKNPKLLRASAQMYHASIVEALKDADFKSVTPMDALSVVGGIDGHNLHRKMDMASSSGYPHRKPKSSFITATEAPDDPLHSWHFVPNEWAMQRVEAARQRCRESLRPNFVFSANTKMEVKTIMTRDECGNWVPKISNPRIFYAAPFEFIYLMRQYYAPILELVQSVDESSMSVGINAMSPQWGELADSLLSISDHIMTADQKKYDQSVTPEEQIPHFRFLIWLAAKCNYSDDDITIMRNLVGCIISPIIDFNSDLVTLYSIWLSGGYATVQFNCKFNAVRFGMCFLSQLAKYPEMQLVVSEYNCVQKAYQALVKAYFYGDDSIVSVSERVGEWFNMITFKEFMSTQGVTVTSALKGDIEAGFLPLTESDYLKRKFRWDSDRQVWTAPLDEKSIMKRLMTVIPSTAMTLEEQAGLAIESSLRDYFEFGEEIFEDRRKKLEIVAQKHNLMAFVPSFPTYQEFVEEYDAKHKKALATM